MAISNRDRLGKALDQLRDALLPYISRQLYDNLGSNWQDRLDAKNNNLHDVALLINLFIEHWQVVFRKTLSQSDRAYVSELKEARNKWAHSAPMASDDVDRYLDTAVRLCRNINACEQADAIRTMREELQQQVFSERARNRTRYQASLENQIQPGLVPWREVITPHPDVIHGRYQQAEFAADLDLVHRGIGSPEYTDPIEFFRRTFITAGLKDLLRIALQRFNGQGGEPVIELQTNFGGGKTHAMLGVYHLGSTTASGWPSRSPICPAWISSAASSTSTACPASPGPCWWAPPSTPPRSIASPTAARCTPSGVSWPGSWVAPRPTARSPRATAARFLLAPGL